MKEIASLFVISFLLFGCSDKPSESRIEKAFMEGGTGHSFNIHNLDHFDKICKIKNFKKINGVKENDITYRADISYDIVFMVAGNDAEQICTSDGNQFAKYCKSFGYFCGGMDFDKVFTTGDTCHKEINVTFVKTDNGWMAK